MHSGVIWSSFCAIYCCLRYERTQTCMGVDFGAGQTRDLGAWGPVADKAPGFADLYELGLLVHQYM